MATYGTPGTPTYSVTFNTLDEMLASVPDNNEQAIGADDVRNSLFTLWERIDDYGFTGSIGPQGFQGVQGQGIQGRQGIQGPNSVGQQGWQGRQGWQGVGIQGNQGAAGPGFTGSVGQQGNQGWQGIGIQGWQGFGIQGNQGGIGLQGNVGTTGPAGSPGIISYQIVVEMSGGFPQDIIGASSSDGTVLHNGVSWISGWSNDPIGDSNNNYLLKIYHPLGRRILNMTTHGLNSGNVYTIAVYGKSQAGTQYCTLVQGSTFSHFTLYGLSYMSTSCSQAGVTTVTITFQA